jgi:hypothetical protein
MSIAPYDIGDGVVAFTVSGETDTDKLWGFANARLASPASMFFFSRKNMLAALFRPPSAQPRAHQYEFHHQEAFVWDRAGHSR